MPASPLTVEAEPAVLQQVRATVASLPDSYRLAEPSSTCDPDILVVDGQGAWAARASAAASQTVVVIDPQPDRTDALEELNRRIPLVVLVETFGGNPALTGFTERAADLLNTTTSAFLTTVIGGPVSDSALLSQIRTLRTLGFTEVVIEDLRRKEHSIIAAGTARRGEANVTIRATVVSSTVPPCHQTVRLYGFDRAATITVPDGRNARPAEVRITDPSGQMTLPTIYETSLRAAFRTLAVSRRSTLDLAALSEDRALLARVSQLV